MPVLSFCRPRKRAVLAMFASIWIAVGVWQTHKPLPPGTHVQTTPIAVDGAQLQFLRDLTYVDATGVRRSDQQIFDAAFSLIDAAQSFIVADVFLFNDAMGASTAAHRRLSAELTQRLLARKRAKPALHILLITDPVNEVYGGARSPLFAEMRANGIEVVTTDLTRLRDSNPGYSALWRVFGQWWGNRADSGVLPNPFGDRPAHVTLRSWLALLNFKANHRKVIVADDGNGQTSALVMSANPHDASSAHSNVALRVSGPPALQIAHSELEIARFSGWSNAWQLPVASSAASASDTQVTYLTEGAIRDRLLQSIDATRAGDRIRMAMFYLSERHIVTALERAAQRGVDVRLILDPNKDAFGHQKDGVPNRPVAHELAQTTSGRIQVRWYDTHGEQFHTKLTLVTHGSRLLASLGSANLTRRNVDDYNLEANLALDMPSTAPLAQQMQRYFDVLWQNDGAEYTLPFASYEDDSWARYWRYRLMEATGLSTF